MRTRWTAYRLGLIIGLAVILFAGDSTAQRPFRLSDSSHWNESARRTFFDRYALTGEVSYGSAGEIQQQGLPTSSADLAFRIRFHSQLTRSLDLSAIIDAVGAAGSRSVALKWLIIKYYHYVEESNTDYALRLALDPSSDGRVGFPQVDLAFLYTGLLSPVLTTDFAIGLRRVNVGYLRLTSSPEIAQDGSFVIRSRPQLLGTRALGTEIHGMMNYSLLLDPAGSNLFVNLLVEAGAYDIVENVITNSRGGNLSDVASTAGKGEEEDRTTFRGGAFWTRVGIEFSRPHYIFSPFMAAPIAQWTRDTTDGNWHKARLHFGIQLTFR